MNRTQRHAGQLSAEELDHAERYWIEHTQRKFFQKEINQLQKGQRVDKQSKLISLNPFLDEEELLCVGGRLQKSEWR